MIILCAGAEEQFTEYWQLQENGLTIMFQSGKCMVFHPERGLIMETKISLN